MAHHVLLGAGPAGIIAAESLRKLSPADTITLVGDETEPPYSRMAIPYLLQGNISETGTYLRKTVGHYAKLGIELLNAQAQSVDVKTRKVHLSNGRDLPFDTLLIATGSHPMHPPVPGMDSAVVHTCWTLADARAIAQRAKKGARVLQLGAGFIGCIIMEALSARGVDLTVVEMGERMVPRMMGPVAGNMIRQWCEAKGVKVHTGKSVERITSNGQTLKVDLSDGSKLEVDLVISAAGVRPAIGYLKDSGITCLQGVLTDEHMQTSVPGVFAAGDCAEALDKVSGKTIVSAIQPNAAEQARVAAANMVAVGRKLPLQAELRGVTQINVLDTLGLICTSFGNWQGVSGGQSVELTNHKNFQHISLQFNDDQMIGCNVVGLTAHVGALRGLIEGQVHLGEWKDRLLHDPTLIMEAYLACAQAQGNWSGAGQERLR